MAALPWISYLQRMVGRGHPTLADTLNTPLRTVLSQSGYDPDASPFPGLMGPVANVKAYGALGNGVANDTTAIQAAINAQHAANAGRVLIPSGIYNVTNLTYYSGTVIEGDGFVGPLNAPGTLISQIAGTTGIILKPNSTASRVSAFQFRGFELNAFGNASNQGGLDCTNCTDYVVEDVAVNATSVFGVQVVGGNVAGDAGFAHFTRVIVTNTASGAYSWIISSSATDQPDGLTFTDCRTSTIAGTWIKYACVGGRPGPGSNVWKACTFETQGGTATADLTVDPAGAGANLFIGCRFENTGTGGIQVTLYGQNISPFAWFIGCNWAPLAGGFTWVDNGPVLSRRFADLNGTTNGNLFQVLGLQTALRTVTTNTTLTQNDHTVLVDATGGGVTITLPAPSVAVGNMTFRIKKKDSSANTVTIAPAGPNIDGVGTSLVLATQNQAFELQTDGANWFITATHATSNAAHQLVQGTFLSWGTPGQHYLQIDGTPKFIWGLNGSQQLTMDTSNLKPTGAGGKTLGTSALPFGQIFANACTTDGQVALTSGTTPAVNAQSGNHQALTILTNIAVVIAVPTNPPVAGQSQDLYITMRNGSGGALTTPPTFNTGANGFKFAGGAIVNPANGTQVVYHWRWDGVQAFWYLVAVSTAL